MLVMSSPQRNRPKIDDSLLVRLAALPPGGQRWLRTVLEAISTLELFSEGQDQKEPSLPPRRVGRGRLSLDEVLSGDAADLRERAKAHPELADDLRGIAEIADLLREVGRERRHMGEEILRESETEENGEGNGG